MSQINRRQFIRSIMTGTVTAGIVSTSCLSTLRETAQKHKFNILFIMSDQHNARALGCYGNKEIKTPHMDRIAREGILFENAFCQTPQCCPNRMTILTGRYPHSHGLYYNNMIEPYEEVTIAEALKPQGYITACIGKMHMMSPPQDHGFDYVVDMQEYNAFMTHKGLEYYDRNADFMEKHPLSLGVGVSNVDNDHHVEGFWAAQTIDFLRRNKENPFCVWMSFYGPHGPIVPSKPWATMYKSSTLSLPPNFTSESSNISPRLANFRKKYGALSREEHLETLALYYGMVSQIDFNIGRVLDELDRLNLTDRTIVVYTADHGEMMGEHGVWSKGVGCLEGPLRVPLLIRLPNKKFAGKVLQELVGSIDIMPTLLECTGHSIPEKVQGRSLIPLFEGSSNEWRRTIFCEGGYPGRRFGRFGMARTERHKYEWQWMKEDTEKFEAFYDLSEDPWELRNEICNPEYVAFIDDLRQQVKKWYATTETKEIGPVLPKDVRQEKGKRPLTPIINPIVK